MITSRAKNTPAMGALNEAATAAATPHPNNVRERCGERPRRSATPPAIDAPRCTIGPSRPAEAPVPRDRMLTQAAATPSNKRIRPLRMAIASITCATPSARPPGMIKCKNRPTSRPPTVGTIKICQVGSSARRLTSRSVNTP